MSDDEIVDAAYRAVNAYFLKNGPGFDGRAVFFWGRMVERLDIWPFRPSI